jgi:hypothetical protein
MRTKNPQTREEWIAHWREGRTQFGVLAIMSLFWVVVWDPGFLRTIMLVLYWFNGSSFVLCDYLYSKKKSEPA